MKFIFLSVFIFFQMCHYSQNELNFEFYDSEDILKCKIDSKSIVNVDWKNQIYLFDSIAIKEIKSMNLLNGSIKMIFKDSVIVTIDIISIYNSTLPNRAFIPCDEKGLLKINDDIEIFSLTSYPEIVNDKNEMIQNTELFDYLNGNKKIK